MDIYALGATLFKTLTGITPPEASEVFNEGFPEAEMRNCGVSDDIILLTSWAMEPMRAKRPQSVEEFLAEVRRLLPMASGEAHRQTGTTAESEPTQPLPRTIPDEPIYEECNGMQIRWTNELSEYKKGKIRELIRHMDKIGYKDRFEYSKYGTKRLVRYPIMSLGDLDLGLRISVNSEWKHGWLFSSKEYQSYSQLSATAGRMDGIAFQIGGKKRIKIRTYTQDKN